MSSSSAAAANNSPCAACKIQRRKCTQECVFAPYFPPDNPQRFAYVHKVFGASNVAKLLNDLNAAQREDAVKSLAYEAEARLRDPVYGCVGLISLLQHKLKQLQAELNHAKTELANYVVVNNNNNGSPHAPVLPLFNNQHHQQPSQLNRNNLSHHSLQPFSVSVSPFQEVVMQHQQEILGFENYMTVGSSSAASAVSPSLALGPVDHSFHHHHHNHHHNLQQQIQAHHQSFMFQKQAKFEGEEGPGPQLDLTQHKLPILILITNRHPFPTRFPQPRSLTLTATQIPHDCAYEALSNGKSISFGLPISPPPQRRKTAPIALYVMPLLFSAFGLKNAPVARTLLHSRVPFQLSSVPAGLDLGEFQTRLGNNGTPLMVESSSSHTGLPTKS
ncbi:hypothetical protein Ahy_A07g033580 [Arachis hypogaea]|uniref:LOB domain-containing protein n=1 Tax=Arachis hypogaea TaxID=3818 RepID=A0A445C9W3_ARAHY|nr:hypothetical protein Ahy_A07g033580 [Arachis hypogaea]